MTEKSVIQTFPRRDADGRVVSLGELFFAGVGGTLVGLAVLAVVEGVLALIGLGSFGDASGWLTMILPALVFFDDVRAWRGYGVRFLVALVAGGVGIGLGLVVAALVRDLPAMISGTIGSIVAAIVYALVWFVGIRWLTGQTVE